MTAFYAALAVAVPVLVFVALLAYQGRRNVARDLTPNAPLEELLMPTNRPSIAEREARERVIADHMADVFDKAGVTVTVRFGDLTVGPRFTLIELARLLDTAGLIDDTRVADAS